MEQAEQYIKNVLSGKELVGELARLTVVRHVEDLKRSKQKSFPFEFSEKKANHALRFLRGLRHPSGQKGIADQPFNMQDNQAFITACLFGWRRKSDGERRFTEAYVEVSRKWGKSLYASFVQLYICLCEGAKGGGIFTAATTREQADEVFRAAQGFAERFMNDSDSARSNIRVLRNSINDKRSGSFIQKVSAEAKNLDGKNVLCAVIDEYHAHPDNSVREVMLTGTGTWSAPMLFTITTAGFFKEYPCFRVERPNAIAVLKGEAKNESLFVIIFNHDTDDADGILGLDPDKPDEARQILKLAKKSNPNLGSTPTERFILDQVRSARNKGSSTRTEVLTKNFNCWMDAPKVWIPEEQIKAVMRPIDISEFEGRVCFTGLDLSATSDITALSLFSPPTYNLPAICKTFFWLPEETVKRRGNDVPYRDWTENGYIFTTPGNSVDYAAVRAKAYELYETLKVHTLTYDQWNSTESIADFEGSGMNTLPCRAYYSYMSPPTKKIEWMVGNGEVQIDENPVMLWMFRNIVLDRDSQDNIKPNKAKSAEKIDGVAAMAYAMYGWLFNEGQPATGSYLFDKNESLITF